MKPEMPLCPNGCIKRLELYAREAEPVEMVITGCRVCGDCQIMTRLPGTTNYANSLFKNVKTQADVINVIKRESERIGLPVPRVRLA